MPRFNLNSPNSKTEIFCKYAVMLFPFFFILMLVTQKSLFGPMNEDYLNFTKEDGILESTTAILYFLSFIFSIVIALNFIKVKNKIFASLCILLSGVFLFAGFEEISWGQRIFHLETTELFSENIQNETNFHNLLLIDPYVSKIFFLIGFYGTFSWIFLSVIKKFKSKSLKKFFIPQRFLIFYFLPALLSYGWDWNSIIEDLLTWDYEYKFLPIYLFIVGICVLVIAGIFSYKEASSSKLVRKKMRRFHICGLIGLGIFVTGIGIFAGGIRYLSIPPEVFSYFLTCCNITLTNNLLDMAQSDFEVVELLLSAGIFLVIISKILK